MLIPDKPAAVESSTVCLSAAGRWSHLQLVLHQECSDLLAATLLRLTIDSLGVEVSTCGWVGGWV